MSVNITLTSSMRSNLSSLKTLASQMSTTQVRLSTGKKVNNAIDNANSYYQSRALTNRASDLDMLLDAMGQSIQTVTTATQGIESGLKVIEQMSSIAQEAATVLSDDIIKITADMTTSQIQLALNKGGIFSLQDDITLTSSLSVGDDVTIVGNGHSVTYAGRYGFDVINGENVAGDAALKVIGNAKISGLTINYSNAAAQGVAVAIDGGSVDIDNLTINGETTANRLYGIQVLNGGKLTLDNTRNINLSGAYSEKIVNGNPDLWAGEYNTKMIVDQMGADNIAAYACYNFAPTLSLLDDENFGQGTWYLPGLGELADMYGTNYDAITTAAEGQGTTGAVGDNKAAINAALSTLSSRGVEAATLTNGNHWSSSETKNGYKSWMLGTTKGNRTFNDKYKSNYVRAFQLLENCFSPLSLSSDANHPQIGDVMYSDKTYGSASDYDSSKTAVGVVTWVSDDGASAKIVSLKDLRVSTNAETGWQEFDPNNPYSGTNAMKWQNSAQTSSDGANITNVKDYYLSSNPNIYTAIAKGRGTIEVTNTIVAPMDLSTQNYDEKFNTALGDYDELISDSSYQGVNLLEGNSLKVMFNETRTNSYTVQGQKADSGSLGVDASHWETLSDVQTSIAQLQAAVSTLRNIAETLGNSLRIIETRMDFTDAMTDVLQTGADDLVLADMNEESANYLALQTRNNLAVNALALASQSNNSVLKLF